MKILGVQVFDINIAGLQIFFHNGKPMTLLQLINDVLMVIFFLSVGLEIKQEILVGELSTTKKAILPIIGALGGMIIPVLCFLLIMHEEPGIRGAAIPMATDIAFALAALAALGSRVPPSLKIFLTALAVADDIGGIIIIAIFYSTNINLIMLGAAFIILFFMYLLGHLHVSKLSVYFFLTFLVWFFFLESGVHPTIAGVLSAFMIPSRPNVDSKNLREQMQVLFGALPDDKIKRAGSSVILSPTRINIINSMRKTAREAISPMQLMEEALSPIVKYFVLPIFSFANAGIRLSEVVPNDIWGVPMAVFVGLFIGKPVGIFLFTYLFVKLKFAPWPKGMNPLNLLALSIFGGIGFTVSLFISALSYSAEKYQHLLNEAKLGIFLSSALAVAMGILVLKIQLKREQTKQSSISKE